MNRPEPIELENNLGPDAVTGEINRVPWMAYDVDEMDIYIAAKDAEIQRLKHAISNGDVHCMGWIDRCQELEEKVETLKNSNAELEKKLMPCLNGDCILTCEVVEKYGKENAELKKKLEDAKASHYAEMVDAGMRERRLKRALWLARAQRANEHYHRYHGKFLCPLEDIPEYVKWKQVERKCRAKAEEYK